MKNKTSNISIEILVKKKYKIYFHANQISLSIVLHFSYLLQFSIFIAFSWTFKIISWIGRIGKLQSLDIHIMLINFSMCGP